MKKIIIILALIIFMTTSCTNYLVNPTTNETEAVDWYGWANASNDRREDVIYELSPACIVGSILLVETIIAPILLTGWCAYEPVKFIKEEPDE